MALKLHLDSVIRFHKVKLREKCVTSVYCGIVEYDCLFTCPRPARQELLLHAATVILQDSY